MLHKLKIGLIINPVAGLGGRVALKGSDTEAIQQQAVKLGAKPEAEARTKTALEPLLPFVNEIQFYSVSGIMGGNLLEKMGFHFKNILDPKEDGHTSEADTLKAANIMQSKGIDLLLFAGGDGTARNILQAVGDKQLCLGIPAGCKIYSGVFTVTPVNGGQLIAQLIKGELIEIQESQVLDINERLFRAGKINTSVFGEMLIPRNGGYVQSVKISGVESEPLVQQEIAAWVCENLEPDTLYIIGSGTSCKTIKDELAIDGSLLGVDVVLNGECLIKDATEQQLMDLMHENQDQKVKLILTIIGGQGILLGRGNHQICHKVIRHLGLENLIVISSKSKITALNGKPLGVDTGDDELNKTLGGYLQVITGYDDTILYPIGCQT